MWLDCAVIGGGPAGLNAALVLGRARRVAIVFDDNRPRNAVTRESHGFITRDGVGPKEFRRLAHGELANYPSVTVKPDRVVGVVRGQPGFLVQTGNGVIYRTRTVILATGLKETLPAVPGIREYYGISLFSCPYCDGWELRDKRLVVISDSSNAYHTAKIVRNWSGDILLCTNGANNVSAEQEGLLGRRGIRVNRSRIRALGGERGMLRRIAFEDGEEARREGGFVSPRWEQGAAFGEALGCQVAPSGGFVTDDYGRTTAIGVYAAGDASIITPSQLVIAAGEGSKAAIGVNMDLTNEDFYAY
ncbi:NAD(P)/FAD-dependent oxidoreductase [Paenibacillus arenilitoris]|uniref:NAD(P)/FAD-dependent oxidoreductase n=1 Tax=Paenibacillus arenilitoris TaxID=2772299 RepID=A0A927CK29_9BACL|nr:NAD(P)/FAD-dependent oxidoreductase [Paenibacillus arenilitoris]MBD2868162.1 NAD(P)/FAD-dependent oxidoreductase [Paenibacillus arenilitoris]